MITIPSLAELASGDVPDSSRMWSAIGDDLRDNYRRLADANNTHPPLVVVPTSAADLLWSVFCQDDTRPSEGRSREGWRTAEGRSREGGRTARQRRANRRRRMQMQRR